MYTKSIQLNEIQKHHTGSDIQHYVAVKTVWYLCDSRNLSISSLIEDKRIPLGIEISHSGLTTQLDFTGVTPYEIWFFDEKKQFTGKTFSFHGGSGTFRVETQARFILIWNTNEDKDTQGKLANFKCKELVVEAESFGVSTNFSGDYGKFPYFIIRHANSPCFSQIPVHLVPTNESNTSRKGCVIVVEDADLQVEEKLLPILLERFKSAYKKVNQNLVIPKSMALVLGPKRAYYLDETKQEATFSDSIPSGKILLDMNAKTIAEHTEHFI